MPMAAGAAPHADATRPGGERELPLAAMWFLRERVSLNLVPLRVLIVDDSPRFLHAARALLEHERLEVVGDASTSAEALRKVLELDPDVALVDVALGRESGLELARRLAVAGRRAVPVILISTRDEDDLADLIADCPSLGFVPKSELSADAIHRLLAAGRPE